MNNNAIGIFDSGLGGLTAVRELTKMLPDENIIYFGDTGRMPYGGRSAAQIRQIAAQNIAFAESRSVKAILAACGTISSNAQDILERNGTKIIGVLKPGVKELCSSGCRRLCVIATGTSIKSGSFQNEIKNLSPDAEVLALACPDFVPMIEAGHISADDDVVKKIVSDTLKPVRDFGCEAMLLGCTHYGIISDAISEYLPGVKLVAAASAAAGAMREYLLSEDMLSGEKSFEEYYTSGSVPDFEALAPLMLGRALPSPVRYIPPLAVTEE